MEEPTSVSSKEICTTIADERKEISTKDDFDSGLDNNSDSGSSWEEDPLRSNSSSDSDDLYNGGMPERSGRRSKKAEESLIDLPFGVNLSIEDLSGSLDEDFAVDDDIEEFGLDDLPEFFRILAKGRLETIDFTAPKVRPEWLDLDKFKRGQKFASNNLFSLNFAEMLSLMILFAPQAVLRPLIFTGKSDSPYKAFRRYLSTVLRLKSWYEGDLWSDEKNEAKKNIDAVNKMHKSVFTRLTEMSAKDIEKKTTLGDPSTTAMWCPMRDLLVADFRSSCPMAGFKPHGMKRRVWISQLDMSITQFGFVALVVTYPEYFGLHYATYDDLDSFCHMWRGLGYLLGIKDKYNYCNGSLEEIRQRTKDFIELAVKPSLREVTEEWEHMSRCMISGIALYIPFIEFESSLLYLCYVIGVDTPRLKKAITYGQYIKFHTHRFVNFLERLPGVLPWLNKRVNAMIQKAKDASPGKLAEWEAMEYSYMKQHGKNPIRK